MRSQGRPSSQPAPTERASAEVDRGREDPAAVERAGQFELRINSEIYLRDGRFDQDRMLQAFERIASGNAHGGFPLSRIVCRMDWAAAEGQSCIDDLIEFEFRVNSV